MGKQKVCMKVFNIKATTDTILTAFFFYVVFTLLSEISLYKSNNTCWTPMMRARSSVGFHLPKSLVLNWFICAFFLDLLLDPPAVEGFVDGLRLVSTGIMGVGGTIAACRLPAASISE